MRATLRTVTALAAALLAAPAFAGVTAYRVGKVLTMDADDRVINNAVVLVEDGKIAAVGKARDIEIPGDAKVVEHADLWLVPGFVELHNHELAAPAFDLNDSVYLTNPGLRTMDVIKPDTQFNARARMGGVTTALLIPGSGTNLSGFGVIAKQAGEQPEDMIVKSPGSLKIAQAGNPEGYWYGVRRAFMNFNLRQTLNKARDYHNAWNAFEAGEADDAPEYNPAFHGFRGLFAGEYPASVHTQAYQVLMTTVTMLAGEFGIKVVLDHSTFDAYKVAPLVTAAGEDNIITIVGPRGMNFDTTQRRIFGNVVRWWQGGVRKLGINTDSPVIPQEQLPLQAAMACWYGFTPYEATAGITRVGAEALMIDDRLGSIEAGKDADFGLWTGDPIDPRSSCLLTVIDGEVAYDAADHERRDY